MKTKYILLGLVVCCLIPVLLSQYIGRNLSENLGSGALPATCTVGDVVFRTDAVAGSNVFGCTATDTWTLQAGSSAAVLTDTFGNLPAASVPGQLFFSSDGPYLLRDTGAAWIPWGPIHPLTEPVDGDFAWINQGTATVSTTIGGIVLEDDLPTADSNIRVRVKTAPSVPYVITATFLFQGEMVNLAAGKNIYGGLCFRESGTGELHTWGFGFREAVGWQWFSSKWTDAFTLTAHYLNQTLGTQLGLTQPPSIIRLRIADDNTNRICSVSLDYNDFQDITTIGRTDFLTANQVGFFIGATNVGGATTQVFQHLLSWEEE